MLYRFVQIIFSPLLSFHLIKNKLTAGNYFKNTFENQNAISYKNVRGGVLSSEMMHCDWLKLVTWAGALV